MLHFLRHCQVATGGRHQQHDQRTLPAGHPDPPVRRLPVRQRDLGGAAGRAPECPRQAPRDNVSLISHTIQGNGVQKLDKVEILLKATKRKEGAEGLKREMTTRSPVRSEPALVDVSTPLTYLCSANGEVLLPPPVKYELMIALIDHGCDVNQAARREVDEMGRRGWRPPHSFDRKAGLRPRPTTGIRTVHK